ncbi:MAG: fructose-bisphosphate aldolase, partial [Acidobacteriota bacterium]
MKERIQSLLGEDASLLEYKCTGISKDQLHLPGPDFIDRVLVPSDRTVATLRNLRSLFDHGRLSGTGY